MNLQLKRTIPAAVGAALFAGSAWSSEDESPSLVGAWQFDMTVRFDAPPLERAPLERAMPATGLRINRRRSPLERALPAKGLRVFQSTYRSRLPAAPTRA